MKLRLGIFIGIMMLMALSPVMAQESDWSVYLFSSDTKSVLRVHEDGSQQEYSLGIENNDNLYINTGVSISPDGRLAVFCLNQQDANPQVYTLNIRDLEENTVQILTFGQVADCRIGGFNTDGTQVAVSMITQVESGGIPDFNGTQFIWRVAIIDVATGEIVDELTSQHPNAPIVMFNERQFPAIALPEAVESDRLVFRAVPFIGTEFFDLEAFIWEFETDTVTPYPSVGLFGADYAPQTGEVVYPTLDESQPYVTAMGMIPPYNVVNLQTSPDALPEAVYFNSEWAIANARFVNDGAQLLVSLLPSMDMPPASPDTIPRSRYALMNRTDGSLMEFDVEGNFVSFADSPDGIIVISMNSQQQSPPYITHFNLLQTDGSLVEFAQRQDTSTRPVFWDAIAVVEG